MQCVFVCEEIGIEQAKRLWGCKKYPDINITKKHDYKKYTQPCHAFS